MSTDAIPPGPPERPPGPTSADIENEIYSLSAETLALTAIVGYLCSRLAASGPNMAALVAGAFDDTANFVERAALAAGKSASPKHTIKALRVVEELRAVALSDHQQPPKRPT